ncbi:NeuD/PglB/VioB family sugar acetyltransferase [Nocardioides sp. cx-169]|uniref:NeuD/PglB/VioB family sugar acetyltransferase n=1 Tax=Nocardioides sp. cx-169 TaxID=2899080 RepID=UPI001E34D54C|nr:NeuD/PglB/VioB family sugar acetyltransferase [Nocardioides sp. cx-169]MCD4533757.1 NeuD/PglB/VioB family sugar acetyltransferase [Nocardioides sp. cx-169]
MRRRLAVVGGGGFGREILDIVDAINAAGRPGEGFDVMGVLDDGHPDGELLASFEVPHLGPTAQMLELPADVAVVVGIAHPQTRHRVVESMGVRERPILIHPTATMGRKVTLGPGAVVCSHVSVANHVVIGPDVQVGANSTLGHDSTLGACVTVSPLSAISGDVHLEDRSFVGTGASINQGLRIGTDAVVGSGAAVVRDVDPKVTVVGNPARVRP